MTTNRKEQANVGYSDCLNLVVAMSGDLGELIDKKKEVGLISKKKVPAFSVAQKEEMTNLISDLKTIGETIRAAMTKEKEAKEPVASEVPQILSALQQSILGMYTKAYIQNRGFDKDYLKALEKIIRKNSDSVDVLGVTRTDLNIVKEKENKNDSVILRAVSTHRDVQDEVVGRIFREALRSIEAGMREEKAKKENKGQAEDKAEKTISPQRAFMNCMKALNRIGSASTRWDDLARTLLTPQQLLTGRDSPEEKVDIQKMYNDKVFDKTKPSVWEDKACNALIDHLKFSKCAVGGEDAYKQAYKAFVKSNAEPLQIMLKLFLQEPEKARAVRQILIQDIVADDKQYQKYLKGEYKPDSLSRYLGNEEKLYKQLMADALGTPDRVQASIFSQKH